MLTKQSRGIGSVVGLGQAGKEMAAKQMFDLSVDMLCVVGVDGYFKVLNPSWSRVLGHTESALMATPYLDFVHPEDRLTTMAEASKLQAGFQTTHFRNRYRCRDGTYRWLAWTATAATDDGLIYAGARDVTHVVMAEDQDLYLAQQQLEHVRSALETKAFKMVFQPIINVQSGKVIGVEALSRFGLEPRQSPDRWFADADSVGMRPELEIRAVRAAISQAARLPEGSFMSVNASPETLMTAAFMSAVSAIDGRRLVVEVTEHSAVDDYNLLQQAIEDLRAGGIRLAIDDAGAGFSSLKHIVRLVPDFIKLDLSLTRDIDIDPVKRALAAAMVRFAAEIGAVLIAEGVENGRELSALRQLGLDDAQGYYLSKPRPSPR